MSKTLAIASGIVLGISLVLFAVFIFLYYRVPARDRNSLYLYMWIIFGVIALISLIVLIISLYNAYKTPDVEKVPLMNESYRDTFERARMGAEQEQAEFEARLAMMRPESPDDLIVLRHSPMVVQQTGLSQIQ